MNADRYTVTAALPYANGPLHIGHLAGAYLSADAYARFLRLMGKDVLFVCGSDEYGAAISIKARKEGVTPRDIVDKYHEQNKKSFERLGISFDTYSRTTEKVHADTAQTFFRELLERGEFEEKESDQLYDEEAQMFLADRFVKGICPKCGHPEAYGDQCENCGSSLSANQLKEPISTITGTTPVLRRTKHWYFSLENHQDWLREWIENGILNGQEVHHASTWKKHVKGQCLSWLDAGLEARSMTRDLDWGIDVPQDIPGSEGKKLYVWLDAPIGYISATKIWAESKGKDWERYWKDDKTQLVHFIGKDNIVFHCIIFPAILKSLGDFVLPKNVPANQFMNLEGKKLSTSRGWAVWVHEYLEDFGDKIDELRYVLSKNMPEMKDSEFTWVGYKEAVDTDLVNNLANFVNRVVVLTNKYYEGFVPDFDENQDFVGVEGVDLPVWHDSQLIDLFDAMHAYQEHMQNYEFRAALKILMEISSTGNTILQSNEPWKIRDEDSDKVSVVMNVTIQYTAALCYLMRPFMPGTAEKLQSLLNLEPFRDSGELLEIMSRLAEGESILSPGHQLGAPIHLFERIDEKLVNAQIDKLKASLTSKEEEIDTDISTISFEDFTKLDIRTASITHAEKVPNTDKLLAIDLDLGDEKRKVVSGIAQYYNPTKILGQEVLLITNLEPRKIKGVTSHGMILMAENDRGELAFVCPPKNWPVGSKVR